MKTDLKPEQLYREKINKHLQKYFVIEEEVKSKCKKYRIDYVLKCKKSGALFGLEVKSEDRMRGNKFGEYLKQASNYSSATWCSAYFGETKLLIFISPAISNSFINIREKKIINNQEYYISFHDSKHEHSNVNGLIGQICNIGEIRSFINYNNQPYFAFIYRNKIIWSSNLWSKTHTNNYKFYNSKL
jgi:hypothetical protein